MDYTYRDILNCYKKLGIKKGQVISLKTDLTCLGQFEATDKNKILDGHLNALADTVDLDQGTIVVPTSSTGLCNTKRTFDLNETPSEAGVLTEFIRCRKDSVRSFHPFESYAAIGKEKGRVCEFNSRHSYGFESPEDRMLDMDGILISIGLHPRFTATVIHHAEMLAGVPYRYIKEYYHPVIRGKQLIYENFYRHALYVDSKIKKDVNRKIFSEFEIEENALKVASLGRSKVYSVSLRKLFSFLMKKFQEDIYIYLETPPENRPYRI